MYMLVKLKLYNNNVIVNINKSIADPTRHETAIRNNENKFEFVT